LCNTFHHKGIFIVSICISFSKKAVHIRYFAP